MQPQIEQKLEEIYSLLLVDKLGSKWINEKDAAKMINVGIRKLRDNALNWGINYRNTNGRAFQYYLPDLKEYQVKTSTLVA